MKKILILILLIALLIAGAYRYDYGPTREIIERTAGTVIDLDEVLLNNKSVALREARIVVQQALVSNGDIMENAPCLAEELVPGWSLDVVHTPRTEEDDVVSNQCNEFIFGDARHLIEYSILGDFVRIVERE